MTTATKEPAKPAGEKKAAAAPPAVSPAKILFQGFIAIDKIDVFSNIRKTMNVEMLKQLTDSIRQRGVKQAVLLRPSTGGRYFIVDGHRRLKAAAAAGLENIPAVVQELTAEEAAIDQAVTYLQRENLGHIEEARGFKLILDSKKYGVEGLAQLIDKSKVYVYRAVSLLELPAKVIDAIEAKETTPAHGHQLLRVPKEHREKIWKEYCSRNPGGTVGDLAHVISYTIGKKLDGAIFPKDVPYADAVACSACPFNSANQEMLFDGEVEGGQCTNVGCFDKKTKQGVIEAREAFQKEFPIAKYIGESSSSYQLEHNAKLNRVSQVSREDLQKKAVRKALAEKKDGLYFGVIGDQWNSPRIVVMTTDDRIADRALGRKPASSRSSSDSTTPARSPREKFIQQAVEEHLEKVGAAARKDPDEKKMLATINANFKGRGAMPEMKKLFPITAKTAVKAFYLDVLDGGFVEESELLVAHGVDIKKETALAMKAAEDQWLKDHPKYVAKPTKK